MMSSHTTVHSTLIVSEYGREDGREGKRYLLNKVVSLVRPTYKDGGDIFNSTFQGTFVVNTE